MATKATARLPRPKISTTVAPETLSYLEKLISKGEVHTIAEAIDLLVERLQSAESRERLELDTAAYFERLSPEGLAEESDLAAVLSASTRGLDFDREP